MQEPAALCQTIIGRCVEFMNQIQKQSSLANIQSRCLAFFEDLVKEAWTDRKIVLKSTLEPQSELEEAKEEADFAKTIFIECQKFMEALRNYEVS
jgi:inorganic pyrophosphatase